MQVASRWIRHGARTLLTVVAGVVNGFPRRLIDTILVVAVLSLIGTLAAHFWLSDTVALVGIGAVLAALAFWKIPQWQTKAARQQNPDRDPFETENTARATLAQALGGLFLVIGLAVTWRQLQDTRQDQLTQQTLTREGQITGRFTTAVGQLSDNKLQIRLGGIYALERIARDSKEDTVVVMEVLTAFVRQRAPWPSVPGVATPLPDESGLEQPFADVQTVLTVIERGHWAEHLSLSEDHFPLDCLDLSGTNLSGARFGGTLVIRLCLVDANLADADLTNAYLRYAELRNATLARADLFRATLDGADLSGAFLANAILSGAGLVGANLENADLRSADLTDAYLTEANLKYADLEGADLSGAYLRGADLSTAQGLTQAQIDSAIVDETTQLPSGVSLPATPGK